MQAISRGGIVAFISASMIACGHSASTDTADASTAAGDASTGEAATRACSPLAPPSLLTLEAVTPDGHYLVGTKEPSTPSSPEVTHLFYGTPDHMAEARVTHMDVGCALYPTFEADGTSYGAVIAYPSCGNAVGSRIYVGDDASQVPMVLTVLVLEGSPTDAGAPASPAAFTYFCF